jgi:hypothetical protein
MAYYVELGRVVSADELSAGVPEGRDAIQAAINELKQSNYVKTTREWNGKSWHRHMDFTNSAKELLFPNTGFSGLLYIDSELATNTSTSTSTNNLHTITSTYTYKNFEKEKEGEKEMPWNLDGEETPEGEFRSKSQMRRVKIMREADATPGAVGKVLDKKAVRNAKYKAKVDEDSLSHRSNKPEEDWNTNDLIAEFYELTNQHAPGIPGQVNAGEIAKCVNKMYREGVSRHSMLKAIRMFFGDTRNLHDAGSGIPLWRRFMAYYPTVHALTKKEPIVYMTEEDLAHQEKMLKLLGGN